MTRLFVTGTDTDVGKTRLTAALAAGLVARGETPTIVKAVQTGLAPGEPGDALEAAALAGCASLELARFRLAADPWSAALAEGAELLDADTLARRIEAIPGAVVVEGAGGAAVPINATETLTTVAARTSCEAVVAVGVRLGCISHARLTLAYLRAHGVPLRGVVLVERWRASDPGERARIARALEGHAPLLGTLEYDPDAARSVAAHLSLDLDKVGIRV